MRYHTQVPTYHVENFGCRATQADGAAIERQFESRGLDHATSSEADLVILNTCTVTNSADQDARAAIRRVQRQNPLAKIIVTGCYAQRAPGEIAALPGVTAVIGNSHKHNLAELSLLELSPTGFGMAQRLSAANTALSQKAALAPEASTFVPLTTLLAGSPTPDAQRPTPEVPLYVSDIFAHTELLAAPVFESASENSRTRPNLKVQDGCDNRCSFCIIPSVRGHSRSLQLPEIIKEVNALVAAGYKELVISGINLGRWGRDLPVWGGHSCPPKAGAHNHSQNFEDLLQAILASTTLEKLRISSVEPMDWTDSLIALVASSPRIAKHAHIPLQSGSDAVLRRMHRKYRPWHYREKIEKIHAAMPTAAIGADVMTGFPGETDAEFESTRRLIADLPFTYLHVFTYSARPGTPAAAMPNQVPVHVARERNRILRDLAAEKKLAFMRSFLGKTVQAITLGSSQALSPRPELPVPQETGSGLEGPAVFAQVPFTEALTDNYQKLYLKGRHAPNQWLVAHVENVSNGALIGSTS